MLILFIHEAGRVYSIVLNIHVHGSPVHLDYAMMMMMWCCYLRAVGRKVLWSSACVCLCALFLSARYLKNRFMDHHQIWWVGAGGEPLEHVQFWCWSDSGCVSRITFPFPLTLMLATASAQVCVPLGHSSLYLVLLMSFIMSNDSTCISYTTN